VEVPPPSAGSPDLECTLQPKFLAVWKRKSRNRHPHCHWWEATCLSGRAAMTALGPLASGRCSRWRHQADLTGSSSALPRSCCCATAALAARQRACPAPAWGAQPARRRHSHAGWSLAATATEHFATTLVSSAVSVPGGFVGKVICCALEGLLPAQIASEEDLNNFFALKDGACRRPLLTALAIVAARCCGVRRIRVLTLSARSGRRGLDGRVVPEVHLPEAQAGEDVPRGVCGVRPACQRGRLR
jgi:hypothetical protein